MFVIYLLCMLVARGWANNIQGVAVNNTLTLGYLVSWQKGWIAGPYLGSAIVVGIQEVRRRGLLPGYEIEWVFGDDYCEPRRGTQVTVDVWASVEDLDGFIGASCSRVCETQALLAAAWGIPVVAWGCASNVLSDKQVYPTFTRLEGTYISRVQVFDHLCDVFGWKKIGIISTQEDLFHEQSQAAMEEMQGHGKEVVLHTVDNTARGEDVDTESLQALIKVIENIKSQVRILLLLMYSKDFRILLITALDLGMMNGEYVFISNEFVLDIIDTPQTYRPEADEFIYNAVICVGILEPSGPEYDTFQQKVIDELQDPQFNYLPHLPANASTSEVMVWAGITCFLSNS